MSNKDELKNRLQYALDINNKRAVDLCKNLNLPKSTVSQYLSGKSKNMTAERLSDICKYLHVSEAWMMGYDVPMERVSVVSSDMFSHSNIIPLSTQTLPVFGKIACGTPKFMDEERVFYTREGINIKADFILIASGDSMINARINDGDLVFIRQQPTVDNGEIAAVAIGDEATLKRIYYYQEKSLMILKSENPKYEDMIYSGEELEDVRILGKAIAFQSDII